MTPLEVAISQIGYTEYPPDSNRTKYGEWYGLNGQPWCMIFVQWCFDQAGTPLPYKTPSCSELLNWYRQNEPELVRSLPETGDIVIYSFGHTGIVESADHERATITAIEGNTSTTSDDNGGAVMRRTRAMSTASAFIKPFASAEPSCDGNCPKNALILPQLQRGSTGSTVRAMQILLMGWGYGVGRWGADGDFGADTEAAVRRFQGWSGLEADGICGPKTWSRLLGM